MIGELLDVLAETATSIYAWPDRDDGRWRWVYWSFTALVLLVVIGFVAWAVR